MYLRLDVNDGSIAVDDIVKRLGALSRAGYNWHRYKFREATAEYRNKRSAPNK